MDVQLLAAALTAFLAPAMPYLVKGGEDLVAAAGKELAGGAWERIKGLWGRLSPAVEERPAASEAAAEVARAPEDADALASLRLQLRKILAADAGLAAEVERLLAEAKGGNSYQVQVHGDGAAAVGPGAKAVGKGGVLVDGDVHGDVNMGTGSGRRGPG